VASQSTHASHCATQPITDNYAQNSMATIIFTQIPRVNYKFPEFSRIKEFPSF